MKPHYPILLLGLVGYIFLPWFIQWIIDPASGWYKPYIIWAVVIVITYLVVQRRSNS